MAIPEAPTEATVLVRTIEMKSGIVTTHAMSNPLTVSVYVRRVGVSSAIAVRGLASGAFRLAVKRARAAGRDVSSAKHPATATVEATATTVAAAAPLCQRRDRVECQHDEKCQVLPHVRLLEPVLEGGK
jgi:hypothetical protein